MIYIRKDGLEIVTGDLNFDENYYDILDPYERQEVEAIKDEFEFNEGEEPYHPNKWMD